MFLELGDLICPGSCTLYSDTHAAGRTSHHAHGAFHCKAVQVRHLVLRNSLYLRPGYFSNFVTIWLLAATLEFGSFQQLYRRRGSFDDKFEGFIGVNSDEDRKDLPHSILGPGIELLTELHDI